MADWNKRYAEAGGEGLFGNEPNVYVRQVLARPGFAARRILVPADGDGRNGRFLAERGFDVTAVDLSETATAEACAADARAGLTVERLVADLAAWTPPASRTWDAAFLIYLQCERMVRLRAISLAWEALAPGGWFALEGFARTPPSAERLGPGDPDLLYTLDEVTGALGGAQILEALSGEVLLEEGPRHTGLARVVRVCARKP